MEVWFDRGTPDAVVCRVDARRPDLRLVGALSRMQLEARRRGFAVELIDPPPDLHALLAFCGLAEALGLEPRGQPERGEDLGADEVVQPPDPPP